MTKAIRASRNAGKKSTSAQSATITKKASVQPPAASQIKVRIVAEIGETSLGMMVLPDELTSEMVRKSFEGGFTNVVNLAQHWLRESAEQARRGTFPSVEFESTVSRAASLLALLRDKITADTIDQCNSRCPDYDSMVALQAAGYFQMIANMEKELLEIFDKVFGWLNPSGQAA